MIDVVGLQAENVTRSRSGGAVLGLRFAASGRARYLFYLKLYKVFTSRKRGQGKRNAGPAETKRLRIAGTLLTLFYSN